MLTRESPLSMVSPGAKPPRGAGAALILLGLFRLFRPFDRRQCLDVGRNRLAILRRELRGIAHHRGHRAADRIAVGRLTGLQQIGDILVGIVTKTLLRDVGNPALALGIGTTGKALLRDDAPERRARRVTLGAMTGSVDEIGASTPFVRFGAVALERLAVEIKKLP